MSIKNRFKEAIIKQDINTIKQIFIELYDEDVENVELETKPKASIVKDPKIRKSRNVITKQSDSDEELIVQTQAIKNNKKTIFITNSDPDESMGQFNEKLSKTRKKKQRRSPYQSQNVKCNNCNIEFDYKKEYPAGQMSESKKILCNKCHHAK